MTIEERNTANAIQDIAKELKSIRMENDRPLIIDWEQRRYEIAKACMANGLISQYTPEDADVNLLAKDAVLCADALIKELKNKNHDKDRKIQRANKRT